MKFQMNILFTILMCLLISVSVFAQQPAASAKTYQNVQIEKFTVREGVEFPADKIDQLAQSVVSTLNKSNRFNQVSMADASASNTTNEPTLKVSGEIIKYVKGNRAVRYMVGMGMGATKIITDVKFTDVQTGEVVYHQTVDGDVTWGIFGGDSDSAKSGVADEIMRVMKKNKFAGEKLKGSQSAKATQKTQ